MWKGHAEWEKVLRDTRKRKLAHNTWLHNLDGPTYPKQDGVVDRIAIQLHATKILTFYPDESIELRMNGWNTQVTRARYRELGFDVWTQPNSPYLRWVGHDYEFEDGMRIVGSNVFLNGTKLEPSDPQAELNEHRREQAKLRRRLNGIRRPFSRSMELGEWRVYLFRDKKIHFVHGCEENSEKFAARGNKVKCCPKCGTQLDNSIRMTVELQRFR